MRSGVCFFIAQGFCDTHNSFSRLTSDAQGWILIQNTGDRTLGYTGNLSNILQGGHRVSLLVFTANYLLYFTAFLQKVKCIAANRIAVGLLLRQLDNRDFPK